MKINIVMTILNNFLHNDYVWIPLYIGMIGTIGWAWWSENCIWILDNHKIV